MVSFEPAARRNNFSRQTWLAARTLAAAVDSDGADRADNAIDAATVLAIMGQLEALPMGGMTPPLTTTTRPREPYSRLFIDRVMYARVKGGAVELLDQQWHKVLAQ